MEHFRLLTSIKTKQLMLTTMPMRANPSMRMLYHSTPLGTFITINICSYMNIIFNKNSSRANGQIITIQNCICPFSEWQ